MGEKDEKTIAHYGYALRYAYSRGCEKETAEDFAAFAAIEYLNSGRKWFPWIFADYLRAEIARTDKPNYEQKRAVKRPLYLELALHDAAVEPPDPGLTQDQFWTILSILPDRQRTIVLGCLEGLTLSELAKPMEIGESRACQLLKNAIERLSKFRKWQMSESGEITTDIIYKEPPNGGWTLHTLEERSCACGCKKTFKVLKVSTQRYALSHHDPNYQLDWKSQAGMGRPKRRPPAEYKPPRIDDELEAEEEDDDDEIEPLPEDSGPRFEDGDEGISSSVRERIPAASKAGSGRKSNRTQTLGRVGRQETKTGSQIPPRSHEPVAKEESRKMENHSEAGFDEWLT